MTFISVTNVRLIKPEYDSTTRRLKNVQLNQWYDLEADIEPNDAGSPDFRFTSKDIVWSVITDIDNPAAELAKRNDGTTSIMIIREDINFSLLARIINGTIE